MSKVHNKGKFVTFTSAAWLIGLGLLCTGLSHATSFSGTASVSILDSFEFIEQKIVNFGTLTLGNGTCNMGPTGALEASGGGTCTGEGQLGEILISGTDGQTISVSVEQGDSAAGLTFTPQLYSDASTVLVGGQTTAKIGGLLNLNGATAGSYNLTYIIIVNYN